MHLNTKVWSAPKGTIWHFWSANRHFKSAELHSFGLWPNSLRVPIRHSIFDFFAKRHIPIHILPMVAYFLSIPVSINRDWISKFNTLFYALRAHILLRSRRDTFSHSQISHSPFLVFSLKLGFLGFKDNCINFFES